MTATTVNPVLEDAKWALEATNLVQINPEGVAAAAALIDARIRAIAYSPRTWREQPLHLLPPDPYSEDDPGTKATLDWILLVSSLNFSFWSELEPDEGSYVVEWKKGWGERQLKTWNGYYALLAVINRAIEEDYLILEPGFWSSEWRTPDYLLQHLFRAKRGSKERIPMLTERRDVIREVGEVVYRQHGNSWLNVMKMFRQRYNSQGTALQLVDLILELFPCFRDETVYEGRTVHFRKRAQIFVAELWAAFYPADPETPHPFLPHGVDELTAFADYRIPQILHQLGVLVYPPELVKILQARTMVASGSREEVSIRAASILGVEALKEAIIIKRKDEGEEQEQEGAAKINSVLLDFYLWDLAKELEGGASGGSGQLSEGLQLSEALPAHRTRSIWY